jgi:hypothetical protein
MWPNPKEKELHMKVLSLGAGVQSTALYLMSSLGEFERADVAIFADTGWEPQAIYEHMEKLQALDTIPIHVVKQGDLRDRYLSENSRYTILPLFVKNAPASKSKKDGMLARQCTHRYKITPINKKLRELGATAKDPAEVWMGISLDEVQRMKPSQVKFTETRWPLIEMRWDRGACLNYLEEKGWEVPKSSCIGCPFHGDGHWLEMKRSRPEDWADAVDYDKKIRTFDALDGETFLHRARMPLEDIEFEDEKQMDLFGNECEGYCGV